MVTNCNEKSSLQILYTKSELILNIEKAEKLAREKSVAGGKDSGNVECKQS